MIIRDLEHLEVVADESKIVGGVDVPAGPIWNNDDAQIKCPVAAAAAGGTWNGQWVTTIPGKMSVCGVN